MKTIGIMICIIFQLLLIPCSISEEEIKSCKEHPMVTGECFLFWGRMQLYDENPRVRIWRVGTTRVFGVAEGSFQLEGYENVPADIVGQIDWNTAMFGDFTVCPFADDIPRKMRPVCVEKAENTVIKRRRDTPQNANRLVDYAPVVVTLTGTLTKEKISGAPSGKTADSSEVGIFLTLEEPIDIRHGDAVNVAENGIRRLQLILFQEYLERLEAFLNRKVIATGNLFHATSEDQPARVTMIVEKLVDPEPRLVTEDIMSEP